MELKITPFPFGERPEVTRPDVAFYHAMGDEGIRQMVSRHYELLRESSIKGMFPKNDAGFEMARQNSADFMIQICGGPDYFNQHRGNPMLIRRHAPFAITPKGRIVWLNCYKEVLADLPIPEELIASFWNYLNVFSNWMVNTKE